MRVRFDLFPEGHQDAYSHRLSGWKKPTEYLFPTEAFRFAKITVPRNSVNSLEELERLGDRLTNDERRMITFLKETWIGDSLDLSLVIKILNSSHLFSSHLRLDHRPQVVGFPEFLSKLLLEFLGLKELTIKRAPDLSTRIWISGVEIGDDPDFFHVQKNETDKTTEVSPQDMFTALVQMANGHGFVLPRFHIPRQLEVQQWAAFWSLLVYNRFVVLEHSNHFWRTFDMVFIGHNGTHRAGGQHNTYRALSESYRSDDARHQVPESVHRLIAEWSTKAQMHGTELERDDFPLTSATYYHYFQIELAEGKYVLQNDIPWMYSIRKFTYTRAYKQWRRAYLYKEYAPYRLEKHLIDAIISFACDQEELRSAPLTIADRLSRYLGAEGTRGHWQCMLINALKDTTKEEFVVSLYAHLPSEFRLPAQ